MSRDFDLQLKTLRKILKDPDSPHWKTENFAFLWYFLI